MRKHVEESVATGAAAGRGRGGRFSAGRKREVVMRLLRGEDLESVSRAVGITAARASHWRAQFLAAGQAGLKSRRDGCPGRRPSSAAGQDRRAADGDRVAVREGGPAGGGRPFGPAEVEAMRGATRSPRVGRTACSGSAGCGTAPAPASTRGGRRQRPRCRVGAAGRSARPRTTSWSATFAGCSKRRPFMAKGTGRPGRSSGSRESALRRNGCAG